MSHKNTFSLKRISQLVRVYWILRMEKKWLYALVIALGFLGMMIFMIYTNYFMEFITRRPDTSMIVNIFWFIYALIAVSIFFRSFRWFRRKESSITYLTLPVSNNEKYIVELLLVIIPLLIYPLLFWLYFELSMSLIAVFVPIFPTWHLFDHISFYDPWNVYELLRFKNIVIFIGAILNVLVVVFVGNIIFEKLAILKSLAIATGVFFLHLGTLFLINALVLPDVLASYGSIFISDKPGNGIKADVWLILICLIFCCLMVSSYLTNQEKEI